MKYDAEERLFSTFGHEDAAPTSDQRRREPRRLALIGCFRPRRCGIATFTTDIYEHLSRERRDIATDIYAMRAKTDVGHDPAVSFAIDDQDLETYRAAAAAINASGAAAVWLQHEFGIFGGEAGAHILELVDRVAAPLVVTLHTVLAAPTAGQRHVLDRLVGRASQIIVMSRFGRETLVQIYGADPDKIEVIEHGTPDRPFVAVSSLRETLGIDDRPVLSTFGLLGPGKGLETAIRALPTIAAQYPDILYRIVGATHPNLVATEGEAYRESLEALAESLGVGDNLAWDNRFLDAEDLFEAIELCDIYLAPYPNLAQVTSGTLAYAVALGRAVISTPFVHARELLADEVGILVPEMDSVSIAEAALLLLAVPEERRALQQRAYTRGRQTAWPVIARAFGRIFDRVAASGRAEQVGRRSPPSRTAIWAMSDGVGILQHGCGIVPDREHGYCIDDNARAFMLMNSDGMRHEDRCQTWALLYASFIQHAWNADDRAFRNFMGYDRQWLETIGSEDSNGRALWALGHGAAHGGTAELRAWSAEWFARTAAIGQSFKNPRAVAFALIGADHYLDRESSNSRALRLVERGGAMLHAMWKTSRRPGWDWFEARLTYDNARLAEALVRAGRRLRSLPMEESGLAALDWLCDRQTSKEGYFRPAGSEGFGLDGETMPFDQQPLEAWATIAACATAYGSGASPRWARRADAAWRWFAGRNDRAIALADPKTGRCRDGLTPQGVNLNVGAESTLAYHLAHSAMAIFWANAPSASGPGQHVHRDPASGPALVAG
jgi:glycosyltransferase involved in cell wall biosynthesis